MSWIGSRTLLGCLSTGCHEKGSGLLSMQPVGYTPWCSKDTVVVVLLLLYGVLLFSYCLVCCCSLTVRCVVVLLLSGVLLFSYCSVCCCHHCSVSAGYRGQLAWVGRTLARNADSRRWQDGRCWICLFGTFYSFIKGISWGTLSSLQIVFLFTTLYHQALCKPFTCFNSNMFVLRYIQA